MKFFQKRWVAVLICIILVITAITIGNNRDQQKEYRPENAVSASAWGEENFDAYTEFIVQKPEVLSGGTVKEISVCNAALDYTYGSICGLAVVDDLQGVDIEDALYDYAEELGLGTSDALLVIETGTGDWYFDCGEDLQPYVNQELEIIFRGRIDEVIENLDEELVPLYQEVSEWYAENVPVSGEQSSASGQGSFLSLVVILLVVIVLISLVSSLSRIGRRSVGGWWPLFFLGRRSYHHHHHHYHNPPPPPNFGGSSNRSFGSGNRGGFGSNRGGGFGGSRGGGFGRGRR